jgi:glutamate 5-kinase
MTLVVKLGSSIVAADDGELRADVLDSVCAQVSALEQEGERVVMVTSGAIARGMRLLEMEVRPRAMDELQAASAVGQGNLFRAYEDRLAAGGTRAAQVLLTAADIAARTNYLNARQTLRRLIEWGVVPVVNENDTTATDEITFGDNDALAAQVAVLVRARLLVLLTEVEGVYSRAPGTPGAQLITEGAATRDAVLGDAASFGKGGMRSKVLAAEMAAAAGIQAVIAGGASPVVLGPLLAGESRGTVFEPGGREASAFKLWLRFGKPVVGHLHVDAGARRAVVEDGASLLAIGVERSEGRFEPGDAVELVGPDGIPFAKGISGVAPADLEGRPRGVEAVHRDRLVAY